MRFFYPTCIKYILLASYLGALSIRAFYGYTTGLSLAFIIFFVIISSPFVILSCIKTIKHSLGYWILAILFITTLGSIFTKMQGELHLSSRSIDVFGCLKEILLGFMPFFSVYYLSKLNYFYKKDLKVLFLLFFMYSIFGYYLNAEHAYLKYDLIDQGITNNIGYNFLSLIPFLIFFRKRNIFILLSILIIFFYIVSSAKRGAILTSIPIILIFTYQQFIGLKFNKNIFLNLFLIIIFIFFIFFIFYYIFQSSDYLQSRWQRTLEGNTSNRTDIYLTLWNAWLSSDSFLQYIFGMGFLSSTRFVQITAHNEWLEMLTSFGLIGVIILFGFFYSLLKLSFNKLIESDYRVCAFMIFIIFFFDSIVVRFIISSFNTGILMILLGYIIGTQQKKLSEKNLYIKYD